MPANPFNGLTDFGVGIGLRVPHYQHILSEKPVVNCGSAAQNSGASDAASSSQPKYHERLALREHGRIFFQKVFEIDCCTSAANYVFVHCGERTHRMRSTMHELQAKLDPKQFVRIHRCTIINIDYVRDFRSLPHGDYLIRLHSGKELKMSRNYRLQFRNAIAALDKQ